MIWLVIGVFFCGVGISTMAFYYSAEEHKEKAAESQKKYEELISKILILLPKISLATNNNKKVEDLIKEFLCK